MRSFGPSVGGIGNWRHRKRDVSGGISRRNAFVAGLAGVLNACCRSANAEPSIQFTLLPATGEGSGGKLDRIEGRVIGARPGQQIVLFARSGVWWVQPLEAQPFTPIQRDGTWKNTTHPGTAYAALLVTADYRPPATLNLPPSKGGPVLALAIAEGRALATPAGKTLHFSGYEWLIRETPGDPGGSPNMYAPANAWTDGEGFLHLRISGAPGGWSSAEVSLSHSLGYGSYQFVVRDVSHLEPACVFTMNTWDDSGPSLEMDIEISRWGGSNTRNAQYVVQPYYVPANTVRFATPPGTLHYSFQWEPGRVTFQTSRTIASNPLSRHVFSSGVPSPGNETVHLNHYVFANTRNPLRHASEVVIEKFEFLP
jgi:hypothetical protein